MGAENRGTKAIPGGSNVSLCSGSRSPLGINSYLYGHLMKEAPWLPCHAQDNTSSQQSCGPTPFFTPGLFIILTTGLAVSWFCYFKPHQNPAAQTQWLEP